MVAYEFRCRDDGAIEVGAPMGQAPATVVCPRCGGPARRSFSAPMTREGSASARSLIEASERSASEPRVVTSLPSRPATRAPQRRAPQNPALQRLPRP